jgi:hypothetical protein
VTLCAFDLPCESGRNVMSLSSLNPKRVCSGFSAAFAVCFTCRTYRHARSCSHRQSSGSSSKDLLPSDATASTGQGFGRQSGSSEAQGRSSARAVSRYEPHSVVDVSLPQENEIMSEFMTRFLHDEERASNVIIWGAAAVITVALFVALGAMLLLK